MKKTPRIAIETLGPPLLGGLMLGGIVAGSELFSGRHGSKNSVANIADAAIMIGYVVGIAYLIAGIPSLIYTAIMETCFARGLSPASWRTVWLSTALGAIAGVSIITVLNREGHEPAMFVHRAVPGLLVGGSLGLIIRHLSKPGGRHP